MVNQGIHPAFVRLRRRWSFSGRILYRDYAHALESCGHGYEAHSLASVVTAKTAKVMIDGIDEGTPPPGVLLGLASLVGEASPIRVIDLGGAAGIHYLEARRLLAEGARLSWVVVETRAMVAAASELPHRSEIVFVSDLGAAAEHLGDTPHLVLASGVLMYLPDPLATLREILGLKPRAVVFSRTGLSPDRLTRVIVQSSWLSDNGVGALPAEYEDRIIRYPNTFVPRSGFEDILKQSHEIVLHSVDETDAWVAGRTLIPQHSYVALRRS